MCQKAEIVHTRPDFKKINKPNFAECITILDNYCCYFQTHKFALLGLKTVGNLSGYKQKQATSLTTVNC